jgi:hypothetical protein
MITPGDVVKGHHGAIAAGHDLTNLFLTVVEVRQILMVTRSTGEVPWPVEESQVSVVWHPWK